MKKGNNALILAAALLLVFVFLLLPFQRRTLVRIDVGAEESSPQMIGFSFPERSAEGIPFRWSEGQAQVNFPDVANRPLQVRLLLHAIRPTTPPSLTLRLNGQPVATFVAAGNFAETTVTVPRSVVGWQGNLTLGVEVEPFTLPPDKRQLGAAIAWVEMIPTGGVAWPSLPALKNVLAPLLVALLGLLGFAQVGGISARLTALLILLAGAFGAVALWQAPVLTQKYAGWLALIVCSGGALLCWGPLWLRQVSAWVSARRGSHPITFWSIVMTVGAIAIYLPLARTTGYWGDIEIYMAWTHQVTHHGIHTAYNDAAVSRPNTTPGLLYPFWLAGTIFQRYFAPDFPPPWLDRTNQDALRLLLRLPALLCTVAITLICYQLTKRRRGVQAGLVAAAAFLFNPAVIIEAAYYGQTGAVHALFMFLGVIGLVQSAPALGTAALSVSMLTKPQAYPFVPLFGLLLLKRYGWWAALRAGLAAGVVAVVMLFPFLWHGTLGEIWERISRLAEYHPFLSATAHNVWWLVSFGARQSSDLAVLPLFTQLGLTFLTYRMVGLLLLVVVYLAVIWRTWRYDSPTEIYQSFAYLFTAFFMLATQIHENHLIPMFPLLLIVSAYRGNYRLYWLFAIAASLNMLLHYPEILKVLVPENPDVWGGAEMAPYRWLSSLFQVSLFVYWTVVFFWGENKKS